MVCILASAVYYRSLDFLPFMFGVFSGTAVSIVKVFLLDNAVNKALTMEQKHAGNYLSIQYLLRFVLTGVVLYLGAIVPQLSLWGVVAGILAFQLAAYSTKFISKS